MGIVYVLPSVGIAGGVITVLEHVNRLLDRGYDATIVTMDTTKRTVDWYPYRGEVHTILEKEIIENADCVIATLYTTAFWLNDQKISGNKYYFVQHRESTFVTDGNEENKRFIEKSYELPLQQITVSTWLTDFLVDEYKKEPIQITNGINEEIFYPEPIYPKTKFRVLVESTRQDQKWKGISDAKEALEGLDVEVWTLSSDEPFWKGDKSFVKPNQDEIRRIYSSCDVLVKSSWKEGFGLGPLQAMFTGTAVVSTKNGGSDDFMEHEKNALLVDVHSPEQIREAVLRLKGDEKLRLSLIEEGFKTTKKHMWEPIIDQLEKIYKPKPYKEFTIERELQEFTHLSKAEIEEKMQNPAAYVAYKWNKENPKTDEEIEKFYKTTDAYLYDLAWIGKSPMRINQASVAYSLWEMMDFKPMLDFGGGNGDLLRRCYERTAGPLYYYDLPSLTSAFASYRFEKLSYDIKLIEKLEWADSYFGVISAIDVLEHVTDVEGTVRSMYDMLAPGGVLYAVSAFSATGEAYPSHLERNSHWARDFANLMRDIGFTQDGIIYRKFRKTHTS